MCHPMFDRTQRRMDALQREIDRTHKAGEGGQIAPPAKPAAAAPRGIIQDQRQRANGKR